MARMTSTKPAAQLFDITPRRAIQIAVNHGLFQKVAVGAHRLKFRAGNKMVTYVPVLRPDAVGAT